MSATTFVGLVNELVFAVVFVVTVARAFRLRTTASVEIAAFFGLIVAAQQLGNLFELLGLEDTLVASKLSVVVIPWLPYLLVRIADHFASQGRLLKLGAFATAVAVTILGIVSPIPLPAALAVVVVGWFVVGGGYASLAFIRESRHAKGVTARRLTAGALGSGLLATALMVALVGLLFQPLADWTGIISQLTITGGAVAYYVGFATPTWLRRAWQEPSVRSFLAHSAQLTREPDEAAMIRRLERLAAEVMGVQSASIGVATADGRMLRWIGAGEEASETPSDEWLAGRAFTQGRAIFSRSPTRDDPENAGTYRELGIGAVMAAPMQVGDHRYGVLLLHAPRPPLFAYSDLELTTVLAQQAGGILEARQLLREATDVQAREVATRAKEDFLSAAAHDLRTPLSSMVLRAQLLQKRMERENSPHLPAVEAVVADASRVTEFVNDLLDAARAEEGRLSTATDRFDLAQLAKEVVSALPAGEHEVVLDAGETWVTGDRRRIHQVLDNLLGNARKYSPDGGRIEIEVTGADGMARLSVRDQGIGVAAGDLPALFQRFSRGGNVDDRRFSGLGLGLYICRRIVEEHGGKIWAESEQGVGTAMHVALPSAGTAQGAVDG